MKFISTKLHAVLDYLFGITLVMMPWLFEFTNDAVATNVTIAFGATTILYTLCTSYELGVIRILPFEWHIVIDITYGLLLAASPWLFDFGKQIYMPHLFLGIIEIFIAIVTKNVPDRFMSDHRIHP